MNAATTHNSHGRNLICVLAACILTIVMPGGITQAPVQVAQRAQLQQA
jgi:hypothetical protein